MNTDREIPRNERATQGYVAALLREEIDVRDPEDVSNDANRRRDLQLGPSDLDKVALMLTRGFSSGNPLSMEKLSDQLKGMRDLYARVAQRVDDELAEIRAGKR